MPGTRTPATAVLDRLAIGYHLRPYHHDPAAGSYGHEAAQALGVAPERVFKTLIATVDDQLVTGVVPVTGQLDLKALAAAVGGKRAAMAEPATAQRTTGYVTGGISPIGQRRQLPVVVDETAQLFDTVLCSAGRRGLQVELAPADLARATGAVFAAIAADG